MRNKILYSFAILILAVFGVYSSNHKIPTPKGRVSSVIYDKSIKTEPGKPIKVVQVIDGDTIVLINGEHLRYVGIDTPEEFDQRKPVQCFAKQAAERNRQLVEGKTITFQKDVSTFDKYGRWLGYVYLPDGTLVSQQLVAEGYAFSYTYPPDISKQKLFAEAEALARDQRLGLWATCSVNTLSTGREQTNPIN